ncbi:MAG TPA: hypothetical protein VNU97_11485 [Rhizomicrobium sp.]|jgi:hypothetical protein|nr:hypothetical protein [Rhizomicrobium sp.]
MRTIRRPAKAQAGDDASPALALTPTSEFRLSRIYAEGWSAANALSADESVASDPRDLAARNPYKDAQQRARWEAGFSGALGNMPALSLSPSALAAARDS